MVVVVVRDGVCVCVCLCVCACVCGSQQREREGLLGLIAIGAVSDGGSDGDVCACE